MGLFSRTEQEKREQAFSKSNKASSTLGVLSGLSLPFKNTDKNNLSRKVIIKHLELYKKFPIRSLEESSNVLQHINRVLIKPKQRNELAELFTSHIYPLILPWYEKYQSQEK